MQAFIPQAGAIMSHAFALHLRDQLRRDILDPEQIASGAFAGTADTAVGFADLVGFTRLGESVSAVDLGAVASRLADLVSNTLQPPVRMIKMIGDAAMLVSPDPAPLLDTSLDLVAAADSEGEDFPQLRAGLAYGPALNRFGDYYGATVNLASRITAFARPGSVLVDEAFRDAVEPKDGYDWSFAGQRRLKGLEQRVPLFRPRQGAGEQDDE
jgi:adenylate cyclase